MARHSRFAEVSGRLSSDSTPEWSFAILRLGTSGSLAGLGGRAGSSSRALFPRRVSSASWSAEEITAEVQASIAIEPAPKPHGRLASFRPAQGLETVLWACPCCFTLGGMSAKLPSYKAMVCSACGVEFTVSATNHLTDPHNEQPEMHLSEARARLAVHFGSPPIADQERFEQDGIVLESPSVRLGIVGDRATPTRIGEGRLLLFSDRLELRDHETLLWSTRLNDCRSVAMEMGNVLQIRTADALLQIDPLLASTAMWFAFIEPWRQRARTLSSGP